MVSATDSKVLSVLAPIAVTAGATTTTIDTVQSGVKADWCAVYVLAGIISTTVTAGNCKLQESDDNSSFADITGATAGALTASTDNGKLYCFQLDLRKRKRYIKLVLTGSSTGLIASSWAELSRQKEAPYSAATRGITGVEVII
jgi:hypothetical protein